MFDTPTDRRELKILALKEKIGKLVSDYEDHVAELRAELTLESHEKQNALNEVAHLKERIENLENERNRSEEEVVQEEADDTSD